MVFAIGLGLTSGGLVLLHAVAPAASQRAELVVLIAANGLATLVRFLLLRGFVFHPRRNGNPSTDPVPTVPGDAR
jgi:hypothetical protein